MKLFVFDVSVQRLAMSYFTCLLARVAALSASTCVLVDSRIVSSLHRTPTLDLKKRQNQISAYLQFGEKFRFN